MQIKLLLACITLFLACANTNAQKVAGYRGKYFMAGYTANFGHNLFISDDDKFRLHVRHGISADYIKNRFTTVGGEISYINTPIGNFEERIDYQYVTGSQRFVSMSSGVVMKQYYGVRNGLIAPIGGYSKFKLFTERMYIEKSLQGKKTIENTYWSPGFGLGLGQSRVIKNSIRVDACIEFDMLFGTFAAGGDVFVKRNRFYENHAMAFYHLFGYSSTFRLGLSGLFF
ncbi:MAG: hypothetical protein ACXWDO_09225 [Bacteroidia bacterium]